ncbi:protein ecdysoneless [Bicyclus anynana]|uniref:Protein ecdysoneless n=1 Tax=Bicyclus anynana TaxID=110368 RepID=A0A6J1N1L8_BICAN|nr:protein ecdysoneless [Bicyclus anynana]
MNPRFEDTLQCIFLSTTELSREEWEDLCISINGIIESISKEYIWHRDEFRVYLPIVPDVNNDITPCLMSTTCFGDNIEDEWFIVYLIFEITKKYNLLVQVQDNDGDFLLIEAADYLPAWANPETTENRVFIFNQHLHLIPNAIASTDAPLELKKAIKLVTQNPEVTKAPIEVEQAVIKRIGEYPQKIKEGCHSAILKLPVEVATVLTLKPFLISPIVNTYCNLDAIDAKLCKDVKFENCINTEVKFTKYLYAMIMQSKIPNYVKCNKSMNVKANQLGLKVTCAYKILTNRLTKDVYYTTEYKKFLNSLIKNGYFKNNLEGSLEYSQLLDKAKAYFLEMECSVSLNACNIINKIKSSDEFHNTAEFLKQRSQTECLQDDDDDWLNVNPDQLNDFLNSHYGKNVKLKNKDPITPHIMTSQLTDFLKETTCFEGIEHDRKEDTKIDFDSEEFVNCLEKMLNFVSNQNMNENYTNSDFSSDEDVDDSDECVKSNIGLKIKAQDLELASKLKLIEKDNVEESVLKNLSQSMKEEGTSGPASTILRQIGINKSDVLDSDDDE